jgi:hypothetical protein
MHTITLAHQVFHAGTKVDASTGKVVTSGGRVLAVSSCAKTLDAAVSAAYAGSRVVTFEGSQRRGDIAAQATKRAGVSQITHLLHITRWHAVVVAVCVCVCVCVWVCVREGGGVISFSSISHLVTRAPLLFASLVCIVLHTRASHIVPVT